MCYAMVTPTSIKVLLCATDHSFFHYVYTKIQPQNAWTGGNHLHIPSKRLHMAPLQCSTTVHFTWSLQTKLFHSKITAVPQDPTHWSLTSGNAGEQISFQLLTKECAKERAFLSYMLGNQKTSVRTSLHWKLSSFIFLSSAK